MGNELSLRLVLTIQGVHDLKLRTYHDSGSNHRGSRVGLACMYLHARARTATCLVLFIRIIIDKNGIRGKICQV